MLCVPRVNDEVWLNCKFTGKDAFELRQLSKKRTDEFDEQYVQEVFKIWSKVKACPSVAQAIVQSHWESPLDGVVATCHAVVHEYYFTLMHWTQKLIQAKRWVDAGRTVQWHMLPLTKLMRSSPLLLMTEAGCRQLLTYVLVNYMHSLILKAEARSSTGPNFCGMVRWATDQAEMLVQLKSVFDVRHIHQELSALLILYVEPDDSNHGVGLAMEAMNRFLALKDTVRFEKARRRVPETSLLVPVSQHRVVAPLGPSTITALWDKNLV